MPTTKPRLYMVLAPRTDAVLRTLAKLSHQPISRVATEILDAAVPALEQVVSAMHDAQGSTRGAEKRVQKVVLRYLDEAQDLVDQAGREAFGLAPVRADAGRPAGARRRVHRKRRGTPGL